MAVMGHSIHEPDPEPPMPDKRPTVPLRDWIVFGVLLPLSNECWRRPRGGSAAYYLQMVGHGILGNGWWWRDG
jgi:hypothetical protein